MDFRNCILDVTFVLAESGQIFTKDHRKRFLELYTKTPEEVERSGKRICNTLVSDVVDGRSDSEGLADSSNILDTSKTNEGLPAIEWAEYLVTHKEISKISQKGLRVGAQCDIKRHDIVVTLKGSVMEKMAGYKLYQRYGDDYAGTMIFNLGKDFDNKWFCAKDYAHTLQADILQHGLESNCEIFISTFKSKPVPIIYATRDIKENEFLCLSKHNISKLNESFISLNAINSEKCRRSKRVPNHSKAFEETYDEHILSKRQDGLEKRTYNGKYGVFTTRKFSKGEFLVEYFGELIDENTALWRLNSMPAELGSYIIFLGKKFDKYCIDASHTESSLARFVGHSIRKSNCKIICKWMDKTPRAFLVAKTTIEENTQLFYDYDDRNSNFTFPPNQHTGT